MLKLRTYHFICLLLLICSSATFAQSAAEQRSANRYEIDAKRIGVSPTDKDALPRSREFIRLDSTYYVGWMYEGIYKFERSADYLGFKYAIPPLEKAMNLLEKDYGDKLQHIYSSFIYYNEYNNRMADLYEISYALEQAYNSIEMPDSVMALLDRMERFNFQRDFMGINEERAWTYHRNRFFTSQKYSFLKNSVEENEQMAFYYCYRQLALIEKRKPLNDYWYGPRHSDDDNLSVYHYLALLHCYNQNYDSANYYYTRLVEGNRVLWGNYAGMQHEIGNIDSSIAFYAKPQNIREHSLSESDYFMPMLYVYGNRTKEAIGMLQQRIQANGSTPGFGWYNIALGRSYLYDGQLDSAEVFLDKAANFKELHINTTLTQSQYDFTINLLKVQLLDKKMSRIKFENKGWWYSIGDLFDLLSLKVKKLMMEYVVVNELADNPERKRIVYDLFCGESTITFDETMSLLKDFSSTYFREKYANYEQHDRRRRLGRYFKMLSARFQLEGGDDKKAASIGEEIVQESFANPGNKEDLASVDSANEKLLMARVYEILSHAYDEEDNHESFAEASNRFFKIYPQLVPFSGVRIKMRLNTGGTNDAVTQQVIDDLKHCNIEWADDNEVNIPVANITFDQKGKSYEAIIDVRAANGAPVVSNGQMIFKKADGVGRELALRLFAKGGDKEFEEIKNPGQAN